MKTKKDWNPNGYIKAHLRKIWRWSPARRSCLKSERCISCGKKDSEKNRLRADHIDPVVDPRSGFRDWNTYIDRLFNGKLQPLCDKCHKLKSKAENAERRKFKKAAK